MATAGDEQQQQAAAAQTAEVTEAAAKEVVSVEMPAPEGWTKKVRDEIIAKLWFQLLL